MEGKYQSGGLLGRNGESETHIKEHGKAELAARKWHMAGPAGRLPSAVQGPVLRCAVPICPVSSFEPCAGSIDH